MANKVDWQFGWNCHFLTMFDCLVDCNSFLFATRCSSFENLFPIYFLYILSFFRFVKCLMTFIFPFFIFYSCAHLSIYVHVKKIIANMDKMHLFFSILLSCNAMHPFFMLWNRVFYIAMVVSKTKIVFLTFFEQQSCRGILIFLNTSWFMLRGP